MSTREPPLLQAAEEHGPFDIVFEAAGASSVTLEKSMQALRRDGVLVLTGIPGGGHRKIEVPGSQIMLGFVLARRWLWGR